MFFLLHYRFLVFARIDVSIARMHFSSWPAYIFSWTFNVFSWLEQMSQLVISFWPTCMFSWPENMFFIFTYTTFFPKCSLRNMYCQIYVQLTGYMFSWPGYMFSWLGCMFSCTFMNFSLHMFNKALGSQFFVHFANNNQKLAFNHVLIGQITRFQLACF